MRRKKMAHVGIVLASIALLAGCTNAGHDDSGAGNGESSNSTEVRPVIQPAVSVSQGDLVGASTDGVREYLGIPFAKPPVGELRWKAPEPADPWEGTLDATKPGPDCAQQIGGDSDGSLSENCLYLNVYTPDAETKDLPVVVFIHGGGYTAGTPNIYDGSRMAETGDAVVVVPAYRLGFFGFFSSEGTAAEGEYGTSGNWGILDQQQALRWVQENITAFGGDPNNVTIVGESAGGGAVCAQLASPTAEGLFHKAIVQSMGCSIPDTPRDMTEQIKSWGCEPGDMSCLREVPTDKIVATAAGFDLTNPVAGGPELPLPTLTAASEGTLAKVPIMVGVTRDEWQGFLSGNYPMSVADYESAVTADYGVDAPQLLEKYPADRGDDPSLSLGWLVGDSFIICPAYGSAQTFVDGGYDVYFYEFADETAPGFRSLGDPFPPSTRHLGATHTSELVYLFDYQATQRKLNAEQEGLAAEMVSRWINFAKTGEPTFEGGTEWKPFDGTSVLELATAEAGGSTMVSDFSDRHQCEFWNSASGASQSQD